MAGTTGTEFMGNTSEDIKTQAEAARQTQAVQAQGRLAPGNQVAGFTVTDILSFAGGEAELYKCEKGGDVYVLKYFLINRVTDMEGHEKLKALKDHPSIMSLVDYGKDNKGVFYEILQYAEGGALSDKTEGAYKYLPLSEEKAVEALGEILEGFKAIHAKGIIHRDIKPDNLFYSDAKRDENGKWVGSGVLLGDFGIASLYQADEGMTSHYTEHDFATEGYEAPEMYAVGKDADSGSLQRRISPAIDYWALGITLWVLLTGKEPFVDEKGGVLSPGQIRRNATNRQTAAALLARSPELSSRMKKLIQGLLVARHKERWNYEKIQSHLAGEDVEVFQEAARVLPPFKIGDKDCHSFIDITKTLLANPVEGKKIVFGQKLKEYMWALGGMSEEELDNNTRNDANKISELIEDYSSKGKEDEGFIAVAYSLTPNLPFVVGKIKDDAGNEKNAEVRTMTDIQKLLESDPDILVPVLRDEAKGFYAYLNVQGYGEAGTKVRDVVAATRSNLKLAPRLSMASRNNVIAPFHDGVNDEKELKFLDDLDKLPDYLKERIVLFIEMKKDDVTAWVENLSGKNLDVWLDKYINQKDKLRYWGAWRYFRLFLDGKDMQVHRAFNNGTAANPRWGLKNNLGDEILAPVWEYVMASSPPNCFIVKKNGKWGVVKGDGGEILPIAYDLVSIFDEDKRLYQCKTGEKFAIINEEKKNLHMGDEPLKIAACPEQPFDVIYDSAFFYNRESFEPFNKKGVVFSVIQGETANYIWVLDDGVCTILNGGGEVLCKTPYSDFRPAIRAVPVQKDGKWGIALADGSKELIPCSLPDVRAGGNFFALVLPGGIGGTLCELEENEKKDRYLLKFEKTGGVSILSVNDRQVIAAFRSAVNLGFDYTGAGDFAVDGKIACLNGTELLWFDIASGKTANRVKVAKEEIPVLLKLLDGSELFTLLSNLKKQNAYSAMNSIIDAATVFDTAANTSWAAQKGASVWPQILALLEQSHTEGLAHSWDVYLSWIGGEALRNKNYQAAFSAYSKAAALKADNAAYQAGCGAAYFHLGDYKNSCDFFSKAAALSGSKMFTVQFLAGKGSAFFALTKFNEAAAAFSQAIVEASSSAAAELYNARAACYQKLNMADKARADINAAAKAPKTSGEKIRGVPLPEPRM